MNGSCDAAHGQTSEIHTPEEAREMADREYRVVGSVKL